MRELKEEEIGGEVLINHFDKEVKKLNLELVRLTSEDGFFHYEIHFQDWTKKDKSKQLFRVHIKDAMVLKRMIDTLIFEIQEDIYDRYLIKMEVKEMKKIILDLCGGTGAWSKPYKDEGYDVRIIDLKLGVDVIDYIPKEPRKVYGILAAPPCPMFSFARTNAKEKRNLSKAMYIIDHCLRIIWRCQFELKSDTQKKPPLEFWALENPNGMLKWFLGKPAFEFNPYDFGDNYKKKTHLWGWFNEPKKNPIKCNTVKFDKMASKDIHPEYFGKLTRQERRAITPSGFAKAFFEANR